MSVHEDKAFFKMFVGVIVALVFFTFSIAVLATKFSPDGGEDPLSQAQMKERVAPIGKSRIAQ